MFPRFLGNFPTNVGPVFIKNVLNSFEISVLLSVYTFVSIRETCAIG